MVLLNTLIRQKDYRFYYDAMLNLTGDTAVY
jgi:hypothetical protein